MSPAAHFLDLHFKGPQSSTLKIKRVPYIVIYNLHITALNASLKFWPKYLNTTI